jgi:hypothetical protein
MGLSKYDTGNRDIQPCPCLARAKDVLDEDIIVTAHIRCRRPHFPSYLIRKTKKAIPTIQPMLAQLNQQVNRSQ